MATPTGQPKKTMEEIEAAALATWNVSQAQIDAAKVTATNKVAAQTPVATVSQNTPSVTQPQWGITTAPAQNNVSPDTQIQQDAISNVVPWSVAYDKLLAQGFTDEQIQATQKNLQNKVAAWQTQQQTTPVQWTQQSTTQQPVQPTEQNAPDYLDNSEARLAEISANLNALSQTSPDMFTTEDAFKRNFKYNGRSQDQKNILDDFYDRYQQAGIATQASDAWSMFSNKDIIDGYTSWVLDDASLAELQRIDPMRYALIKQEIDKNTAYNDANSTIAGIKKVMNDLGIWVQAPIPDLQEQYDSMLGTEEITWLRDTLTTKKWEIDALDEKIFQTRSDLEEQFKWTGISRSRLEAIVADQTEALNKEKNALSIWYNTELNRYNGLVSEATNRFSLIEKQYQLEQQQRQSMMQELWFAMAFMSFETPAQADERAWQNMLRQEAFTTWDINSTDPVLRKKAVSNAVDTVLAEFAWIPIQRSREQIIWDIQKLVDWGMDLGTAITQNLRQPIMNKPEYKSFIDSKFWTDNKPFMLGDTVYMKNSDWDYVPFNPVDIDRDSAVSNYWSTPAVRNFNPWNITDTWFWGQKMSWERFTVFSSPQEWLEALVSKIKYNQTNSNSAYFGKTLIEYMNKYAPSSDGNNPTVYANDIANKLWVNINTKISDIDTDRFAAAIASHEDGNSFRMLKDLWLINEDFTINRGWAVSSWIAETILGSWKFTKSQEKSIREAIASENNVLPVVKSQARALMWASEATNTLKLEQSYLSFKDVVWLIDDFYAAWGNTSIFKWNMEKTINRLWEVNKPELVTIATRIATALQSYRNAISGTAYSEQEWKDIESIFPWINKSKWLNDAIIKWRLSQFESDIDNSYYIVLGESYYDVKNKFWNASVPVWDISSWVLDYINSLSWGMPPSSTWIDLSTFPTD